MPENPVPDKQKNERVSTRFEGVHQRESRSKRFKGRPDVCYEIDYRDQQTGKRVRKSIGWRSEGFTAELAASMRRELLSDGKKKAVLGDAYEAPLVDMPFSEAWEIYRRDWLEGRTKSEHIDTINYRNHLKELADFPLSRISVRELDALMGRLERKGLAPQTVRHIVALVRRVMRKMVKWKLWRGELPFEDLELPKLNNARTRYLTPDEARRLLALLAERTPRMWLMALISMHCGLRFSEIAVLTYGDVEAVSRTLHVRDPKSGKARQAVLTPAVLDALRTLPSGHHTDLLFPSRTGSVMRAPSDAYEDCVRALGLNNTGAVDNQGNPVEITDRRQRVVFHTLRHTYASWLAMSGQGQAMIADLLGHSTLEMSRRYTHLMPDARKATAQIIDSVFAHDEPPK